jgi:DnaK suppressor protein
MSTIISAQPTAFRAVATRWGSFRALLDEQRADCVREREVALAEAATSMPDPVAMRRAASLLLTIAERLTIRPFAAGCVACQASAR